MYYYLKKNRRLLPQLLGKLQCFLLTFRNFAIYKGWHRTIHTYKIKKKISHENINE